MKWLRGADVLPSTQPPAANAPHPRAVQFDGRHYAKAEPPPKFTSGDFTISLWLNPVRLDDEQSYDRPGGSGQQLFAHGFAYHDQPGNVCLAVDGRSGRLDFHVRTASNEWLSGWDPPTWPLHATVRFDQWNHVVVTRRDGSYGMWLNGAKVGSYRSSANVSDAEDTNPFIVGASTDEHGVGGTYHGQMDDFRIFRRCLSDKEIGTLYDCGGDAAAIDGEGRVKLGRSAQAAARKRTMPHPPMPCNSTAPAVTSTWATHWTSARTPRSP